MSSVETITNRWIEGQQIGLLAYMLSEADYNTLNPGALINALEERLVNQATTNYKEKVIERKVNLKLLHCLPSSTLHLLNSAAKIFDHKDDALYPLNSKISGSLSWLVDKTPFKSNAGTSRLSRVSNWADHLLLSHISADRLIRLGADVFGTSWLFMARELTDLSTFDKSLATIRNVWTTTDQRCEAIAVLCQQLEEGLVWQSAQIENYLYHRQFFWPLLVLDDGSCISLPVAIDIYEDPGADIELATVGTEHFLNIGEWRASLLNSVRTGKLLWRSKRGNYGRFRRRVMSKETVVRFDFTYARKIVQVLSESSSLALPLGLTDKSAEAYFAQAVLNRLLGQTNVQASAITGAIGERLKDLRRDSPLLLDWKFEMPAGSSIHNKLSFAFSSRLFERVVLPEDASREVAAYLERTDVPPQTVPVKYVYNLAAMADVVQVRGWQPFQYVRCPDLAWAIHGGHKDKSRPGVIPPECVEVKEVVRFLKSNQDATTHIEASPLAVVSALWYLNIVVRNRVQITKRPPTLSWACIRVQEDETDMSFWHLFWWILGAPRSDFEAFYKDVNIDHAVARIAEACNRFEPNFLRQSHRAPDVLVILGGKHLETKANVATIPSSQHFSVALILERLQNILRSNDNDWINEHLGRTRILIIDDEGTEPTPIPPTINNIRDKSHPVRRLSVFRTGFTLSMAELILCDEHEGSELLEELLKPLVEDDLLREVSGSYFLPSGVKQQIALWENLEEPDWEIQAANHFLAGRALAPYVSPVGLPSLDADIAFFPEHIYEAYTHFQLAMTLSWHTNRNKWRMARADKMHLLVHLSIPCWDSVDKLSRLRNATLQAYEMAQSLIAWEARSNEGFVHSNHLATAARTAWKLSKANRGREKSDSQRLWNEAIELFEQSVGNSKLVPGEEYIAEICYLSYHIEFLLEYSIDEAIKTAERLCQLVDVEKQGGGTLSVEGSNGSAIENVADKIPDHRLALRIYRAGMLVSPSWSELWIKGLGAAVLCGDDELAGIVYETLSGEDTVGNMLIRSFPFLLEKSKRGGTPAHVRDRFNRGLKGCADLTNSSRLSVAITRNN